MEWDDACDVDLHKSEAGCCCGLEVWVLISPSKLTKDDLSSFMALTPILDYFKRHNHDIDHGSSDIVHALRFIVSVTIKTCNPIHRLIIL